MSGTSGIYAISNLNLEVLGINSVQGHSRHAAPKLQQEAPQVQVAAAPQNEFGYADLPGVRQSPPVSGRL